MIPTGLRIVILIFLSGRHVSNEALHFHELIHVIQWQSLGPERFLKTYAEGLERFGYENSPLEKMAYEAEDLFTAINQLQIELGPVTN